MRSCLFVLAQLASADLGSFESLHPSDIEAFSAGFGASDSPSRFTSQTDAASDVPSRWETPEAITIIVVLSVAALALIIGVIVLCVKSGLSQARFGETWHDPMRYVVNSELLDDEMSS